MTRSTLTHIEIQANLGTEKVPLDKEALKSAFLGHSYGDADLIFKRHYRRKYGGTIAFGVAQARDVAKGRLTRYNILESLREQRFRPCTFMDAPFLALYCDTHQAQKILLPPGEYTTVMELIKHPLENWEPFYLQLGVAQGGWFSFSDVADPERLPLNPTDWVLFKKA